MFVLFLCISSVTSQYGDFYTNLEALFSGPNVNPTPSTTKTPLLTPRPSVSLGQLLALDTPAEPPKPKQTPAPQYLNPRVGLTRGIPARTGINRTPHQGSNSPNDLFTMMNLNSLQDILPNLLAPSGSPSVPSTRASPATQSAAKSGSSWQGISLSDSGPGQSLGWDYSANGLDHGSNTGLESGNMVGGAVGGSQEPFLPLADHSPGSTMADQPGQMADWSAPPVSKDTYKYDDEPTPKPKPPADGESMAKAILRGQVRRWQWNYSTTLLQGEMSGRGYGGHYDNSVQCCHRLPYICGVDGMCVIDKNECNEFCICASNPTMPHCIRDVIPRIKKTMAVLEKNILERVSIELNLPVPVPLPQTSLPLLVTTTMTTTTSTRRPFSFILTRKSSATPTTTKKLTSHLEVTPLQTTRESPTLTQITTFSNQSRDIAKMLTYSSPVSLSTSSTTHLTTEVTRNYDMFFYQPPAFATTTNPITTSSPALKTILLTTEQTPPTTTTTIRPVPSTAATKPFVNPFQFTLQTPKSTESVPVVNMELRYLRTKNSVFNTTSTPPHKDIVGLLSTQKTTSFVDSSMMQLDGSIDGNTRPMAYNQENSQFIGTSFDGSAFGINGVTTGNADASDPSRIASLQNLDSSVYSTTTLSETTIKETTTQTSTEGSYLTTNSTLKTDVAGTSNIPFDQTLVSMSENSSINDTESLQISTASNFMLDAHKTLDDTEELSTANLTAIESITTSKTTIPLNESDTAVRMISTIWSGSTSTNTSTVASTTSTEPTIISSSTAANAINPNLTFTLSSTSSSLLNSTLAHTSSSTAVTTTNANKTDLSFSTPSYLQQKEISESVESTVRFNNNNIDQSVTPGISVYTASQPDNKPTETTEPLNTTRSGSGSVTTAMQLITIVSPSFNTSEMQTNLTMKGNPALNTNDTEDYTTTPIALYGPDSSSNVNLQNSSDLVDGVQEGDFLALFNGNNSRHYSIQNIKPGLTSAPDTSATDRVDMDTPCGYDCDKRGGRCLMGDDFKPNCVVMDGDPCDHFQCINGMCALSNGLYACKCGEGWTGTFCEQPCSVDCGDHGVCGRVGDNMTGCICEFNYTGHRCGDKKKFRPTVTEVAVPMDGLKAWEVAVVAVVTAVCLGLVCVLLPYILWRRQWLPMRKLVFYFQEYEDDDDKEYDAFISYKSTPRDERFILHHLYPRLEKELDFRLCLHFRDFPPGEPIANNIIHAIENSRRTIMVLSPSYVASEWCRMEYQKAQYEMLRLKHKIIPIVLEDVSSMPEMDVNLKTIIDTVTYIEWPGEEEPSTSKRVAKFWKLLELSMPKKKDLSRSLSSIGSCASDLPLTSVTKTCFNSIVTSLLSDDVFTSSSLKSCSSSVSKLSHSGSTCGVGCSDKNSSSDSSSGVKTNSDSGMTKTLDSSSELSPVSENSSVSLRSKELFSENYLSSPVPKIVYRNDGVGLPRPQTDTDLYKKDVDTTITSGVSKSFVPAQVGQTPSQVGQSPAVECRQSTALVGQLSAQGVQSPAQVVQSPALVVQLPTKSHIKNSPVVVMSKPHLSSDDFIVEIRETGAQDNQIKVTSRSPRKYASQLLV